MNQRFGILVHQVLERYHGGPASAGLPELLGLLEAGWRRGGFGDSEEERQFRAKATQALVRYHERFQEEDGEPVWFERAFQFRMGPHLLRGRVDRVDRLPDGGYELIDYKTGRPKTPRSCARTCSCRCTRSARASRGSSRPPSRPTTTCSTTRRCRCERSAEDRDWITETVLTVADGILGPGVRADAVAGRPARCATTGSPARRPSARSLDRRQAVLTISAASFDMVSTLHA